MKLKCLKFDRGYRDDGPLVGGVVFVAEAGEMALKLTDFQIEQILEICRESLVRALDEQSQSMRKALNSAMELNVAKQIGRELPASW